MCSKSISSCNSLRKALILLPSPFAALALLLRPLTPAHISAKYFVQSHVRKRKGFGVDVMAEEMEYLMTLNMSLNLETRILT